MHTGTAFLAFASALAQVAPPPRPPDPMIDPDIWGFCGIGGPPPAEAPVSIVSIFPEPWLVVPGDVTADAATLLGPWILDPSAAPPSGVEDPTQVDVGAHRWLSRGSCDPGSAKAAFTTVRLSAPEVRMARLTGASWMLVDGELFVGDPDRRGHRGVPVALAAGENRIFVAADGSSFELELWKPATRLVIEAFDIGWPVGDDLTFPIFNASAETLRCVHVHYGHAVRWTATCKPSLTDWRDGGYVPPLSMQLGRSYYDGMFEECELGIGWDARDVFVPICVYANEGELADRRLLRRTPDEKGRVPNNFDKVPRQAQACSGTLARLYPAGAVHVYGTKGTAEETRIALAAARFDQQLSWYHTGQVPLVVSDVDYLAAVGDRENNWLPASTHDQPVVLRGNADTNAAWSRFVPDGAPVDARRGWIRLGAEENVGEDLAGWVSCPKLGPNRSALFVLFDTGAAGSRLVGGLAAGWRGSGETSALFQWAEPGDGRWSPVTRATR